MRSDLDSSDRRWMQRALALARRGLGQASPNPTVGCVIAKEGRIIGEGWHRYSRLDHAEAVALQAAGTDSRGSTAYVTLEPCSHQGRTPPCAEALVNAGVRRVVVAMIDPNPRVSGGGIRMLQSAGIQVDAGLLQKEAVRLNEPFACHITTGRPLVVSKAGMSLDGRIATATGDARWITSEKGRQFSQHLRLQLDAILVGVGTMLADDPELTYRGHIRKERPLLRVILDSCLRTPPTARALCVTTLEPTVIMCAPGAPDNRKKRLEEQGAEVIPVPRKGAGLDLVSVLDTLGKRQVQGLLVEGGSEVHWSFLEEKLVDKFYFIIAPIILGGKKSVPCVGGKGIESIGQAPQFRAARTFWAGPDLVLETYPSYSRSMASPWLS